jgi:predicted nucleic acid-binding protein
VKIFETTPQLHGEAWNFFSKYRGWRDLSYVDCLSFALMKNVGMGTAFSFDEDFRRFGFQKLPQLSDRI